MARDRNSEFKSKILKPYQRNSDELLMLIIKLTKAGMSTREISGLLRDSLGDYLSATAFLTLLKKFRKKLMLFIIVKLPKSSNIYMLMPHTLKLKLKEIENQLFIR